MAARKKKDEEPMTMNPMTGMIILGILIIIGIAFSWATYAKVSALGTGVGDINTGTQEQPAPQGQNAPDRVDVSVDDDAFIGDKDAEVVIVEFSDFECPYCGRFFSETYPQLKKDYIDTGKVKLVFRDFPLSFHPNAQKAHEAAECAGDQGKFFEMHDVIFENQQAIGVDNLKKYAADLGLDTTAFNSCLDNGDKAAEVAADFNAGRAAGVSGTPTFFVNGIKLVGAQPYQAFQQIIDAEMS